MFVFVVCRFLLLYLSVYGVLGVDHPFVAEASARTNNDSLMKDSTVPGAIPTVLQRVITVKVYPPKKDTLDSADATVASQQIPGNKFQAEHSAAITTKSNKDNQSRPIDYVSLCYGGMPYVISNRVLGCTAEGQCPNGYWCHIGSTRAMTYCCSSSNAEAMRTSTNSQCDSVVSEGEGIGNYVRWGYDQGNDDCYEFMFRGQEGNGNNFASKEECTESCVKIRKGCDGKIPLDEVEQCGSENNFQCREGFICQFNDYASFHCCPPNTWRHQQVKQSATTMPERYCDENIPSKEVKYCNASNGFTCPEGYQCVLAVGNTDSPCCPVKEKEISRNRSLTIRRFCNGTIGISDVRFCTEQNHYLCPSGFVCEYASNQSQLVCCPGGKQVKWHRKSMVVDRTGLQTVPTLCAQPVHPGNGNDVLQRWYFDSTLTRCKNFLYLGSGGNSNNFVTLEQCERTCGANADSASENSPCKEERLSGLIGSLTRIACSSESPENLCPANFYCHVGKTIATTICCPKTTEIDNPCPIGSPAYDYNSQEVLHCSTINPRCPPENWCHYGSKRETTVCCPSAATDPCLIPKLEGTGAEVLQRYYFDTRSRVCKLMIYTGRGGNQNNFLHVEDCEVACPVIHNPCPYELPAMKTVDEPIFCSNSNRNICPPKYWCHFGATFEQSLCCLGTEADRCRLPAAQGNGKAVLPRFYFNADMKKCVHFMYSGTKGNQNNFLTLEDCRSACHEFRNPCRTGNPHVGLNGRLTHCGSTSPSICPVTYWCHIGATLESSVCCPEGSAALDGSGKRISCSVSGVQKCPKDYWCHIGATEDTTVCCPFGKERRGTEVQSNFGVVFQEKDLERPKSRRRYTTVKLTDDGKLRSSHQICSLPLAIGDGDFTISRTYYNQLTKQCVKFVYSGAGGNANNFLSKTDCENACPVFQNPCALGEPALGDDGLLILCTSSTKSVCPKTFWCHFGDLAEISVCCPGDENPCIMPKEKGHGQLQLARWYFDFPTRRCSLFSYSGAGGNTNNFLTEQECKTLCPEFENPCPGSDSLFARDTEIVFCNPTTRQCPMGLWCHVGKDTESTICCPGASEPCLQPLVAGEGNDGQKRWYFNQNYRSCIEFEYNGRHGNQNNFLSEVECAAKCPVHRNPCTKIITQFSTTYCSAQKRDVCPPGSWCHIGADDETTVCCPEDGDTCELPVSNGEGNATLLRWYYDKINQKCHKFFYAGEKGNSNSFVTETECNEECSELVNPCGFGEPYVEGISGSRRHCEWPQVHVCPKGYWCHVGDSHRSSVCCPALVGDPCAQKLNHGAGHANLSRWHFDAFGQRCKLFSYGGFAGNQNNFLSEDECVQKCNGMRSVKEGARTTDVVHSNPIENAIAWCVHGRPALTPFGELLACNPDEFMDDCPKTYYCSRGYGVRAHCCPTAVFSGYFCSLKIDSGLFNCPPDFRGQSSIRYAYDAQENDCVPLMYSGCGGNLNNFSSKKECLQFCAKSN
ncbi:unnamed protein product [Soboliphyme baturini]|uniref:Kunitz/Bovine pancreatic trypsin inhibitor domain protein n=1 Tax=Soboliphyme baturini TaxID=241478 RepID=A0A183IFW4_9BILA|nr:unnamed protein product [Soboliphyme baturini]